MANQPGGPAALFSLSINGTPVPSLQAFGGLGLQADIAETALQHPVGATEKHVANFHWTPGRASVGIGMGQGMYTWIQRSLDSAGDANSNGAFTVFGPNGKPASEAEFVNAQLTGFTVPTLDASSKEPGRFEISFESEQVRWTTAPVAASPVIARPKSWIVSNFRFELEGLPCNHIAAIESFSWICPAVFGDFRDGGLPPRKATIPDLTLSIAAIDQDAWAAAAQRWFIDGHHLAADEKSAKLTLLGPSLADTDVLGTFEFTGVGFKSFLPGDHKAGSDHVMRFTVVLYAETMRFSIPQ